MSWLPPPKVEFKRSALDLRKIKLRIRSFQVRGLGKVTEADRKHNKLVTRWLAIE